MKRGLLVVMALCMFASLALAQEPPPQPTQNPSVPYRLFSTTNIYTLLKLDTRTGQLWQVQWGDKDHRFTDVLNSIALVSDGKVGRFTLYPTFNVYTFILLDQEAGDAWHVQWGKAGERFVVPIE